MSMLSEPDPPSRRFVRAVNSESRRSPCAPLLFFPEEIRAFFFVSSSDESTFVSHMATFFRISRRTAPHSCGQTARSTSREGFLCQLGGIAVSETQSCQPGAAVQAGITLGRLQRMEKSSNFLEKKFRNTRTVVF